MSDANVTTTAVAASIHDRGVLLLHVPSGMLFTSNRVGARIWEHLERNTPARAIAEALSREYRVAFDTAMTSTKRFLAELAAHGLIDAERLS